MYVEHLFLCSNAVDMPYISKGKIGQPIILRGIYRLSLIRLPGGSLTFEVLTAILFLCSVIFIPIHICANTLRALRLIMYGRQHPTVVLRLGFPIIVLILTTTCGSIAGWQRLIYRCISALLKTQKRKPIFPCTSGLNVNGRRSTAAGLRMS